MSRKGVPDARPRLLHARAVVLRDVPLRIDPDEVRAFEGYKPAWAGPPGDLDARLDATIEAVAALIRPRVVYRAVAVARAEPDALTLAGGARLEIPGIGPHWGPVETAVVALATVGAEPEALVAARQREGDLPGARLADSAASAAVECLAEWTNDYLCQLGVAAGLRVTNRISPGLAGWALAGQATLFGLCPAAEVGVVLHADGAMAPAKSISFLVGVGGAARVDHYFVQCRRCWAARCPARRTAAVGSVHREGDPAP